MRLPKALGGARRGESNAIVGELKPLPQSTATHAFDAVIALIGALASPVGTSVDDQRLARAFADLAANLAVSGSPRKRTASALG